MTGTRAQVLEKLDEITQEVRGRTELGPSRWRARASVHLGTCGISSGADKLLKLLREELAKRDVRDVMLVATGCAGQCIREPMITVEVAGQPPVKYANLNEEKTLRILDEHVLGGRVVVEDALVAGWEHEWGNGKGQLAGGLTWPEGVVSVEQSDFYGSQVLIAMRNRGRIDPDSIEDYISWGGYRALAKALFDMTPQEIISEVNVSGLRGRGGAGFPTGLKWEFCSRYKGKEKYILCNGDEGDPGAFMDRCILESDPHSVVEGMLIAGRAIGATQGYIYVRAEYPLAIEKLEIAVKQAREYGFLGRNVMGTDYSLDIELCHGAGAFVCGEETALMRSIEGKRGYPIPRPPFPAEKGLWGQPSVLNNVETFANVPPIILHGGQWFSKLGTEKSKGTKVFALAGAVNNIGLIEVPMGTRLGTIVHKIGGGIRQGRKFKAIQLGGPSGGCLPESLLDLPADYESVSKTGAIMGSGGMIVIDETNCMVDVARFFLGFTAEESCGKCTPCRIGTSVLLQKLEDICNGKGQEGDIELLEDLCRDIIGSSLCGLGQTAPNPVLTTIKYFRDEYEAHIRDKRCPALVCKPLITYGIDSALCTGCMRCAKVCPVGAVTGEPKAVHVLDPERCTKCGACFEACKFGAITRQ